ncbi:hypothetical protein GEV33_004284 [Tenebrio molitor]|uniref:Uncharacterized protein n=1 Tax=Tenebrio molitor TaxID=7067 RepID=A0A8J6HQ27_TENMO|nr:hypothetical protein GEV33_004284 [Tenebrio molitor]
MCTRAKGNIGNTTDQSSGSPVNGGGGIAPAASESGYVVQRLPGYSRTRVGVKDVVRRNIKVVLDEVRHRFCVK